MDNKATIEKKYGNGILTMAMVMMFLFFIVQTLFNTKGEPREAIVAVSMLNSGNWILPQSFGLDIPYKPPFLAWCIAVFSWIFGGSVTECTARMPSVLATIILIVATNRFFRNHGGSQLVGAATAWVTVSSIEVFRAATACRVDMVLTMFMVCAMFVMFTFFERGRRGAIPWGAVLLMSGAALTKGPVGIVLPCLVVGCFRLLRGDNFWSVAWRLAAAAILACVVPAMWYVAAYHQGGEAFKTLALEENFGRMTGTMSYESHFNPAYYNLMTLAVGMLPYTLLALFSLFVVDWKNASKRLSAAWRKRAGISPLALFALTALVVILVFYTIPKSKRSVYLLPMYPFLAFYVVKLIEWLKHNHIGVLKLFTRIIAVLTIALPIVYGLMISGLLEGVKAFDKLGFHQGMRLELVGVMLGAVCLFIGLGSWRGVSRRLPTDAPRFFGGVFGDASMSIFAIYVMLNIAILPSVLSQKSDSYLAAEIERVSNGQEVVYGHVEAPMLRFFTANFYLNDRMRIFEEAQPRKGVLVVGEKDFDLLKQRYRGVYRFKKIYEGSQKSCDVKQIPFIVEFFRLK